MRSSGDPAGLAALVREQVRALDPDMPIFRISTMTAFFHDRAMLGPRLIAQIVTATGGMVLFMAVIGLYGIVAFAVSRRTREIGIRLALGATPASVMRRVLNQGAVFTAVGLAIGMALVIPDCAQRRSGPRHRGQPPSKRSSYSAFPRCSLRPRSRPVGFPLAAPRGWIRRGRSGRTNSL